jgi:hypothetical protein
MYHLQNAFILTSAGFLYIFIHFIIFFSLCIKYLGIFLSDMKNTVTEDIGKAFTKAKKNYFHFFGG